jgi:hypothetical protein
VAYLSRIRCSSGLEKVEHDAVDKVGFLPWNRMRFLRASANRCGDGIRRG